MMFSFGVLSRNYTQERFHCSTPLQISDNKKLPVQPRPQSPVLHLVVDLCGEKQGTWGLATKRGVSACQLTLPLPLGLQYLLALALKSPIEGLINKDMYFI